MIINQCVVVITLASVLVLTLSPTTTVSVTTPTMSTTITETTTIMEITSHTTTEQSALSTTGEATTSPPATSTVDAQLLTTNNTTEFTETHETTEKPATSHHNGTSVETHGHFAFLLSNVTSTQLIIITVGGFTVLTAMPLVIIMILIMALGCMCKKYKGLKKRLTMPAENVASINHTTEMTTTMDNDVLLRNIVILDGIDTGENVAYGRTSTVIESCDNNTRRNTMSIQSTETDRQNYQSSNSVLLEDVGTGGNVAYGSMSVVIEDHGNDGTIQDTAEDDGDTDYVINDMYASIDT